MIAAPLLLVSVASCTRESPREPTAAFRTNGVHVAVDCSDARAEDFCEIEAHATVQNDGPDDVRVSYCTIDGYPAELVADPPVIAAGTSNLVEMSYPLSLAFDRTVADIRSKQHWRAECFPEPQSPPAQRDHASRSIAAAESCSENFYLRGPEEFAASAQLPSFDPQAVAAAWGRINQWQDDQTQACEESLDRTGAAYDRAKRDDWPPFGSRLRWMTYRSMTLLCESAVRDDYPGPARELLQGKISTQEAARRQASYAHPSQPAYEGCLIGVHRGLRDRAAPASGSVG